MLTVDYSHEDWTVGDVLVEFWDTEDGGVHDWWDNEVPGLVISSAIEMTH